MGVFGGQFSGSNSGDIFGFATGGMYAGADASKQATKQSAAQAAQARADADAKAAAIAANIKKLRGQYGIWEGAAPGDAPVNPGDPGVMPGGAGATMQNLQNWKLKTDQFGNYQRDLNAWNEKNSAYHEAQSNQARLSNLFDTTTKTWQDNQNTGLQDSFAGALNQNRFQMARQGMVGSGVDANQQSDLFGNYLKTRGGITQEAAGMKDTLQSSLDAQRQTVERDLASGSVLDLSGINSLRQQGQALKEATANIPAQSFGQMLSQGGQLAGMNAEAQGAGYSGYANYPGMNRGGGLWSGTRTSAPSSSGSTTGRR